MADLKSAYLVWGDDDAKIDSWRARVLARAEAEAADATLDVLRDDRLSGEAVAEALGALTLTGGRRYVLADGIERWSEKDVAPVELALSALPPGSVAVLLAHTKPPDSRKPDVPPKPIARLVKTVERCGGEVHQCSGPKGRGYPRWTVERGKEIGVRLETDAAQVLLSHVGQNQRRLTRELEKLAVYVGEDGVVSVEAVEALTVTSVEKKVYELADALIEEDRGRALRIAEELRERGEDMMAILFGVLRRIGDCHRAWTKLAAGMPAKEVEAALRMKPWLAKRVVAQARRADGEQLERALESLADLDWAIRGGGSRDPDTALTLMLARSGA
jgi:DNA polymerase III subunit delta